MRKGMLEKKASYKWLETTLDFDDQTALDLLAEINDVLDDFSPDLMFMLFPSKRGGVDVALMRYDPKKGKHFLKK